MKDNFKTNIIVYYCANISDTIIPYNPNASAKINISIIPTKILSCCPSALAPASPHFPIAIPPQVSSIHSKPQTTNV